jgi:t-SNARE complex subunit (syntaxin)
MRIIRGLGLLGLVAGLAGPAGAQEPPPDPARAELLRQMIEERFAERLARDLGLNADQTGRVQGILAGWAARRRELEREERRLRQDLVLEMRPGVAADEARVSRILDAMLEGRLAYVQTFRDEMRDLSAVLSPVQRAQYLLLRDRLMQRVEDIRNQRPGPGVRRPPGGL